MHSSRTATNSWPAASFLLAGFLLLAFPASAQIKFGDFSTDLSGTIAPGYTADYGNQTASDHTWTVGGAANFNGSYYNPNFLSFNVGLYLNQSRANSNFQSISDASGIDASANIFGGSRFPGSINYSKAYNSEGNYAVPGMANYVTHGNSDTFGFNWSENLPDAPSFSAGFQMGSSQYSVYGTSDQGQNAFHSLNLHSGYKYAGFVMGAYYSLGGGHALIPEVVSGEADSESKSSSSALGFNVSHVLPLKGSVSAGINRSSWNSEYLGAGSSGTIDMMNALAAVHPAGKLTVSVSANYSDNLAGQLEQSVVAAGGVVSGTDSDQSSNSLDLLAVASYAPLADLQGSVFAERRSQSYLGQDYGVQSYGASATYAYALLDGTFNAAMTVTENTAEKTGENSLGFSTTENYSKQLLGWQVNGSFGYAQNVQTLLVTYTNSFYNYSANARRRWGKFNVSAGAGASRTGLTEDAGTANSSQSYNASIGYGPLITATGSYSKASGQALETGSGLVPVPVGTTTSDSDLVSLFGGNSYSIGLSSTPVKKFVIAAAYSKSLSNTFSNSISSTNQSNQFNTLVQYQFRKLNFNSGFARIEQGFSTSGTAPQVVSSFYIGVSRWFNFF